MAAAENHLIELLPRAERARLKALAEAVDLTLSTVLLGVMRSGATGRGR